MCFRLFIASNGELPLIPWRDDTPSFNVCELGRAVQNVRERFSLPNVVEAGAHTGCGCGFFTEVDDPPDEHAQHEQALHQMVDYLDRIRSAGVDLEVFLCWEGGEFETARTKNLSCADFLGPQFPLEEQELGRIIA